MNNQEIHKQFKRYRWGMDDMLKAELTHLYSSADEKTCIQITKIANDEQNGAYMPDEWAELTLSNGSENEKIALARFSTNPGVRDLRDGKSLEDIFLESDNQLIRCALYENPGFLPEFSIWEENQVKVFENANFIERLALVRNSNIGFNILARIYNPDDKSFSLTDEQRISLVSAFRTNEAHVKRSQQIGGFTTDKEYNQRENNYQYNDLWDLAMKWLEPPRDELAPSIACMTFGTFPCESSKMLEIYRKLKNVGKQARNDLSARQSIFHMLDSLQLDKEKKAVLKPLIKEATNDPDKDEAPELGPDYSIRGIAYSLLTDDDRPQDRTEKAFSLFGKSLGIAWQVIENLITLVVLLIILSSGNTKFESIVLSILALIYLSVISGFALSGYAQIEISLKDIERFNYIRKLMNEKLTPAEKEGDEEVIRENQKAWKKGKIKFWISAGFNLIFYLIIIFKILSVTVLG